MHSSRYKYSAPICWITANLNIEPTRPYSHLFSRNYCNKRSLRILCILLSVKVLLAGATFYNIPVMHSTWIKIFELDQHYYAVIASYRAHTSFQTSFHPKVIFHNERPFVSRKLRSDHALHIAFKIPWRFSRNPPPPRTTPKVKTRACQ